MIIVNRLGGSALALNPDLIERAEATPDTVITLTDGHKIVVSESLTELIELVRSWRADVVATAYHDVVTRGLDDAEADEDADHPALHPASRPTTHAAVHAATTADHRIAQLAKVTDLGVRALPFGRKKEG